MPKSTNQRDAEAFRITSASVPKSQDIRGREKRYLISMGIRSLCFVLAVVSVGHWFMWVFLAASFFLPTIAVIAANVGAHPDPVAASLEFDRNRRALTDGPADD